jgi:hypothetical protein
MMMMTGTTGESFIEKPIGMDVIGESPYVIGMRKDQGFRILDVILPKAWEVPPKLFPEEIDPKTELNVGINVNVSDSVYTDAIMYLFFSPRKSFSQLYAKVMEVVTYNQELEERLVLLNKLQQELQVMFDTLPLKDLKKIKLIPPKTVLDGNATKS